MGFRRCVWRRSGCGPCGACKCLCNCNGTVSPVRSSSQRLLLVEYELLYRGRTENQPCDCSSHVCQEDPSSCVLPQVLCDDSSVMPLVEGCHTSKHLEIDHLPAVARVLGALGQPCVSNLDSITRHRTLRRGGRVHGPPRRQPSRVHFPAGGPRLGMLRGRSPCRQWHARLPRQPGPWCCNASCA